MGLGFRVCTRVYGVHARIIFRDITAEDRESNEKSGN